MVTRFNSISNRKLSNALTLLTSNKSMVATSDYGEFHKMVKRYILTSVLGSNAQVCNTRVVPLPIVSHKSATEMPFCLFHSTFLLDPPKLK